MTKLKKTLLGVAASMALAAPVAQAGLINASGVIWDPDYVDGNDKDFVAEQSFTQWFSKTSDTVGSVASFGSAVNIGTVLAGQDGSSNASEFYLSGAGEIFRINDPTRNVAPAFPGVSNTFCPGCELTYVFGGIGLNKDNTFDVSNAWAQIYVDQGSDFYVPATASRISGANNGDVWLDLKITDLKFRDATSTLLSGFTVGTFEITGGLAKDYFQAPLVYNGSAFFSRLTDTTSTAGNGSVQSNSAPVPEPATLALLGMGLMGMGAARKRSKKS